MGLKTETPPAPLIRGVMWCGLAWLNFWGAVRRWQFHGKPWRVARFLARRANEDVFTWRGPL